MYPAAVCRPPCPGRSGARPASDRPRRRPSARSAGRRSRTRPALDRVASTGRSFRTGSARIGRVTQPSAGDRRSALATRRPLPIGRTSRSPRTSWSFRRPQGMRAAHHGSTTLRRTSTHHRHPSFRPRRLPSNRPRSRLPRSSPPWHRSSSRRRRPRWSSRLRRQPPHRLPPSSSRSPRVGPSRRRGSQSHRRSSRSIRSPHLQWHGHWPRNRTAPNRAGPASDTEAGVATGTVAARG